jgi:hypothetical protein
MLVIRAVAPLPLHEWSYIVPVRVPAARPGRRAPLAVLAVLATAAVLLGTILLQG